MMIFLLSSLLALRDDEVRVTFYAIRASREEKGVLDPNLKEIEKDLRELAPYNAFETAAAATLRFAPGGQEVRTGIAVAELGRYSVVFSPQQPLGGTIELRDLTLWEDRVAEEFSVAGGVAVKAVRRHMNAILKTTVQVPEGKLAIVGSVAVEGPKGPATIVIAAKAAAR
ncbi:MAG: hypothetical protein HYY17_05015 [Planctomycetes bacterium]|nr:hypothetical protein [Planctomycetota bacterium]